jgi:hypothetical protein
MNIEPPTEAPGKTATLSKPTRPLFIPLKTKLYDAFVDGSKNVEYRLRGPRWNADTCRIGRPVILSKGSEHRRCGA